jgi:hypothetical protein
MSDRQLILLSLQGFDREDDTVAAVVSRRRAPQPTGSEACRSASAAVGVEFCEQSCYRAHSAQEHAMADDPPPRSDLSDEEVRRMVMSIRQQSSAHASV